ncbi:MAG: hypothetical protein HC858_00700 [Brachymonas sp.]|nr:hypothetical protein [Brachymonas sp.]
MTDFVITPGIQVPPAVQTGNVFVYNGSSVTSAGGIGSFAVNSIIARDATPRPRANAINISNVPSAAIAGTAEAFGRAPTLSNLHAIGGAAAIVGNTNDLVALAQHVWRGNGAEAVTVVAGAGGQALGACKSRHKSRGQVFHYHIQKLEYSHGSPTAS